MRLRYDKQKSECSIVTAFYDVPSKQQKDQYYLWAKNLFQIDTPIILFTDSSLSLFFKKLRKEKRIHIIEIPFDSLEMWIKYREKWEYNAEINIKNNYSQNFSKQLSPQLFCLWSQKSVFVELAINKNPFSSHYFLWCDIGSFRDEKNQLLLNSRFPIVDYFQPKKVLFNSIYPLCKNDFIKDEFGIIGGLSTNLVSGKMWGGDIPSLLLWRKGYETMLNKYFDSGKFAGIDEVVMLSTLLNNPSLGIMAKNTGDIRKQNEENSSWNFLGYLLSGYRHFKSEQI